MSDEVRSRVLKGLPYIRCAVREAASQGRAQFGVLAVQPDGAGQILARFDAEEFMADLVTLLDAGPLTQQQIDDAADKKRWDEAVDKVTSR